MPPSETQVSGTVQGSDFGSILGNALGRVVDLATIDFLYDRNLSGGSPPEQTTQGQPVDDIAGRRQGDEPLWQNPFVIGGGVLAAVLIVVLVVRK